MMPPDRPTRLWPVVFGAVGLLMAFHPMILSGFQQIQTDLGDTRLNNYILEHGFRWLTGDQGHSGLWNPPFYYPQLNVGAYSDIHLGTAPLYGLWRILGFHPDTSFQLWMLTVMSLNFLAAYLWLQRGLRPWVRLEPFAASAGAFVFAYASSRIAQIGHQQMLPHFYSIAALYALTRILPPVLGNRSDPEGTTSAGSIAGWIAVFFASVTLQLYAGFYLGWFLLLALGVAALWLALLTLASPSFRHGTLPAIGRIMRRSWKAIAAATVISAALLAPMAWHYLAAASEVGYRSFEQETVTMVPRILSWGYLGSGSWLYGWQATLATFSFPAPGEHRIGIGVVTTLAAAAGIGIGIRQRPWLGFIALCAITIGVATTLYPGGFTPWRYLAAVIPGAGAVRAIARIGLLMLVPAALGVALILQRILTGGESGAPAMPARAPGLTRSRALAAGLAILCVAEQGRNTPHYDKYQSRAQVDAIVASIDARGPGCLAFYYSPRLPPGQTPPEWRLQMDALWAQMLSGLPTVNGYSGLAPSGWQGLYDNRIRSPEDESRIRQALERWALVKRLDPARICWIRTPLVT